MRHMVSIDNWSSSHKLQDVKLTVQELVSDKYMIQGRRRVTPYEFWNTWFCLLAARWSYHPTTHRRPHVFLEGCISFGLFLHPGETGRCRHGRPSTPSPTQTSWREVDSDKIIKDMKPHGRGSLDRSGAELNSPNCHVISPLIVYGTVGEKSPNGRRRSARQSGRCADAKFPRVAETAFWARRRCWDYGGRLSSFLAPEKLTDLRPVCSLFRKTVVYIVSWSGLKPFVTKQMEEITRLEWIIDFSPRSLLAFITLQMPLCSEQKLNGEVIKVNTQTHGNSFF